MHKRLGITLPEVLLITAAVMLAGLLGMFFLLPVIACGCGSASKKAGSAQNNRQMALAGIMYGGDYDDRIPLTTNGWLSRMQNVADDKLTVNAPAPGTQDFPANAAGGRRTDAWPLMLMPYIKSRGLFVNPVVKDVQNIWSTEPKAVTNERYDAEGPTYRNQNRFPYYGLNYMFLSPLRIPKGKRKLNDAVNYAVSESHRFTDADDPSGTVFFTESQRSSTNTARGFFVVNAPGMWPAFANNKDGYVAFWSGTPGSGDWASDADPKTAGRQEETNFVYTSFNGGCNASFLDGHVKYYRASALAAGTDYASSIAGSRGHLGSGAKIVDKKKYLWNLSDKNFYGQ